MGTLTYIDNVDYDGEKYKIDSSFLNYVVDSLQLNKQDSEKARNLYIRNSQKIFNSLNGNKNILINGEVQSGKTNNLIVASSSINNVRNYDLIIYLTGRLNSINDQNHSRFFDVFKNFEDKYFITKIKNPANIDDSMITEIRSGRTMLINMLKSPEKIESLYERIKSYNLSFLLINDEGDDSSLTKRGMEVMQNLSNLSKDNLILTITASPYENLVNETIYDDYVVLESSEYYCGIEKFNYIEEDGDFDTVLKKVINEWIKDCIENGKSDSQLLINESIVTEKHKEIMLKVQNILSNIHLTSESDEASTFAEDILFNDLIFISNSENKLELEEGHQIIIGGHNLSRGVTFRNLTHQILFSNAEKIKAATLMQRARWCGYRKVDKVKIYVTKNIKNGLEELIHLQEETKKYKLGKNSFSEEFKNWKYNSIKLGV